MNKPYLKLIIGTLILICISLGSYFVMNKNQISSGNNTQVTSTANVIEENPSENDNVSDETESKIPALDLAKLQGKDRLYTEEEGQYENLSEEEQKVLFFTYCYKDIAGSKARKWTCDAVKSVVENARLVALKDGIAVLYSEGDGMPRGWLYIYDLSKQVLIAEIIDNGNLAFSSNYIIMAERLVQDSQILQLYRPGMSDFIDIPDSQSQGAEYVDRSNPQLRDLPIEFGINSITTYLHTFKNCVDIGGDFAPGFYECEVDTKVPKIFDISNLP